MQLFYLHGVFLVFDQQNTTAVVFAQPTNNTLSSSSPATTSDEETGVNVSHLSSLHANDTLLSRARFSTAMEHSSNNCDQSLWDHVYHPSRLQVSDPRITVTGTIDRIKAEPDDDLYIRVNLDPQYANLLNDGNVSGQVGDLVVEPIC